MAFYIAPGVKIREMDETTTIVGVSTSVAVNVLRNTYKGPEHLQEFIVDDDKLIDKFGKPTDKSYKDLLSSVGYLKNGNSLYATRVMPKDATFAGISIGTEEEEEEEEEIMYGELIVAGEDPVE
ncbi:MAG: hypothetical protein ACOCRK_00290 [bacterium]